MPYLSENIKIEGTKFDKRIKLTPEDKTLIKQIYAAGKTSQRKLALQFNVNRRTIQFVLDPDKLKENLLRRSERGGFMQYYDKDKHAATVKKHRAYKESLKKEGLISLPTDAKEPTE